MKYITKYIENRDFNTTLINVIFQFKLDKEEILAHTILSKLMSFSNEDYSDDASFAKEKLNRYIIKYSSLAQSINDVYFMNFSMLVPSKDIIKDDFLEGAIIFLLDTIYRPNIENGKFKESIFETEKRIYVENLLNGYKNINFIAEKNALDLLDSDGIFNKIKYKDLEYVDRLNNEDVVSFYNKYIKNIKPNIFINGDVDIELCEKVFSDYLSKLDLKNNKVIKEYNHFYDNKECLVKNDESKYYQSIVYMCYKVKNYKEDDFYKLYLVNLLLSSSASEILLNKLRKENNLVYTCGSSVLIRNGLLLIKALTNKNSIKLVSMLIESIIKELSDIDKYKDNINNIIRRLSLDIEREKDNFYISTANIINEYYECDISSEEELEVIKNISNEELLDLINRLELCSMYTLEGSCG